MKSFFIFFVIYFSYTNGDSSEILPSKNGVLFEAINECIRNISQQEQKFKPTLVIDSQYFKNKTKSNVFTTEVIEKVKTNNISILLLSDKSNIRVFHDVLIIEDTVFGRTYSISALVLIYFETCDDIDSFNFKHINKEMKHLIIVSDVSSKECIDKLRDIKNVYQNHLTFILPEYVKNKVHYKMYTFIPEIDGNTCGLVIKGPTLINICSNGKLQNSIIFPPKNPINLNQCPLKVGMATLYPFSTIENKELLQTYDHINESVGSDMEIIKIVAENINASLDLYYVFRKEENPFGDYEFLKYLFDGSLDVCAGGMYRIYGDQLSYSGVYARQAVAWIYYAERVERSWEILIGKVNGLYIFIIFYISYSLIWYFIRLFDGDAVSLKNTLLYGWGALFGATSLQDPRSVKQKILNLMYLVMSIYLSAYISIQLYSFLTIRGPPQMFTTNDDIMKSGRTPYLKESTKYFISDKKYLDFANTSSDCISFRDCAENTYLNNGLTIMLQGNFYEFQAATTVDGEARILRATENVLTVYNEMLIRKDSPLVSKFQRIIKSLFEAGITERLYNEAIGILVMAKADVANSNTMVNSYSCQSGCAITLMQFAGAFYVWLFGCVLSCFIFILELCVKWDRGEIILE